LTYFDFYLAEDATVIQKSYKKLLFSCAFIFWLLYTFSNTLLAFHPCRQQRHLAQAHHQNLKKNPTSTIFQFTSVTPTLYYVPQSHYLTLFCTELSTFLHIVYTNYSRFGST